DRGLRHPHRALLAAGRRAARAHPGDRRRRRVPAGPRARRGQHRGGPGGQRARLLAAADRDVLLRGRAGRRAAPDPQRPHRRPRARRHHPGAHPLPGGAVSTARPGSAEAPPGGSAVDAALARARARIDRLTPAQAHRAQQEGALPVDTRPEPYRAAEGSIPGAVVIERNVLEWRLDPTGPDRIPEADRADRPVVVFCNEGYASSLAAAQLRELGLTAAADLAGGFRAWKREGLPVDP